MSFWFAVQFLTRLPTPSTGHLSACAADAMLARSRRWWPLVGGLAAAVAALAFTAATQIWPRPVAVVFALAVEAVATGAFHEDAVADFFDAMGGGHTREQKLEIMRDSRVGSYGALGLMLAVLLRAALLYALPATRLVPALLASGAIGRWTILLVMATIAPVPGREGLAARGGEARTPWSLAALGLLLAAPAFAWAGATMPIRLAAALLACLVLAAFYARWLGARLGGSTGDCLGFAACAGQSIALAIFAAR